MKKNKKIKKIVVTFVATFVLICSLALSVGASDIIINRPSPYRMLSCLGDEATVSGEIYPIAMIYVTGNDSSEPGKYSFIVFTEKFTSYFYEPFVSSNPSGDIYDFWEYCLNSSIPFTTSSGNTVTFNTWISNYSAVRDLIYTQFVNSYSTFGDTVTINTAYNTGFTNGIDVGYTNALNDTNSFKEGLLSIFNAPIYVLNQVFNFELFGINLYYIITAILTISIVAFVIKLVL